MNKHGLIRLALIGGVSALIAGGVMMLYVSQTADYARYDYLPPGKNTAVNMAGKSSE